MIPFERTSNQLRRKALFAGLVRRRLLVAGFEGFPNPVFFVGHDGAIVEANANGRRLLALIPLEGERGSVGRRELVDLFARAFAHDLGTAQLRFETAEGILYYEARFGDSTVYGIKTIVLSDVTVWKEALAEKETLLHAIRAEKDRPIAVCARCEAIRDSRGEWGPAGGLSVNPQPRDRLSHGLCPACLAEELGHIGLDLSTAAYHEARIART